eukprot:Protomagalhaensia_sp_Gyna_25__198@NODE_1096_length_2195_cov_12_324675_g866_i0_p2_GENE_NODE_1096_length_2195_cov_12_324675_g866_i0NODE_1096_length_2195_cov_12_324675_g866_i0_p2_ORF_typecomplete_len136_score15_74Alpha_GJ/PF03229_13/0_0032Alpha_GJ/PF03229_13/6_7e03Trp_oprn_chp/PF09534_10/0_0042BatD/PF13584_6/0_0079SURF1/PF02104_15/16SURF1/PF02104_15/1DUF3824/PF12868_7/7_1e03DUF3824/PF12868_7/0_044BatA/PF07584_11/0_11GAPT/PF11770_8/0_29DUF4381/PF14316_6/0_79Herpes_gE/PF02480_16/2_6TT_ORF1/PF02956_14
MADLYARVQATNEFYAAHQGQVRGRIPVYVVTPTPTAPIPAAPEVPAEEIDESEHSVQKVHEEPGYGGVFMALTASAVAVFAGVWHLRRRRQRKREAELREFVRQKKSRRRRCRRRRSTAESRNPGYAVEGLLLI